MDYTAASGCDSIVTLYLAVNLVPGDTLSTGNYSSYQWLLNGSAINNATAQQLSITQSGEYSVVVTDSNGCSDTSAVENVTGVNVPEINNDYEVKLYPNPNAGSFTLKFFDSKPREVVIMNVFGQVVIKDEVVSRKDFDISSNPQGIYFLRIMTGNQPGNLKFIVVL